MSAVLAWAGLDCETRAGRMAVYLLAAAVLAVYVLRAVAA